VVEHYGPTPGPRLMHRASDAFHALQGAPDPSDYPHVDTQEPIVRGPAAHSAVTLMRRGASPTAHYNGELVADRGFLVKVRLNGFAPWSAGDGLFMACGVMGERIACLVHFKDESDGVATFTK